MKTKEANSLHARLHVCIYLNPSNRVEGEYSKIRNIEKRSSVVKATTLTIGSKEGQRANSTTPECNIHPPYCIRTSTMRKTFQDNMGTKTTNQWSQRYPETSTDHSNQHRCLKVTKTYKKRLRIKGKAKAIKNERS